MSFKSEAAKVRANIAAGKYQKKPDYFGGFVEQVAYGIRKMDEEKRQEELDKRKAARAEARRIAEEQRKEDAKLKAQEKLINGYLTVKGYDPTDANKAAVRDVVTNLGITGYSDLDAVMQQSSTYIEGTPQSDIDQQMSDLGQLRQGDGPFEAEKSRVDSLSPDGRIEFGKPRGKNVLEMTIEEVRFELSDKSITTERRNELTRRLESFGVSDYISTEMYHPDGRTETPRTAEREAELIGLGFSTTKPAPTVDFEKRTLYRDGAKRTVYNETDLQEALNDNWSTVEPADPEEFKPFFMYAQDGRKIEIRNQDMLDEYSKEGSDFGFVQPAPQESYKPRTLYMNGAKYTVTSQEEENAALAVGWSKIEPADQPDFVPQDLYLNGSEVRATTQVQFDEYTNEGYSPVKPANHGQMLTAKQAALQSFLAEEGVSNLQGEAYRTKLAEFERMWEEQSKAVKDTKESYGPANYTADLIKYGTMAISDNEADRKEAAEWFNTTKLIIENSLNTVSGMDDAAKVKALVDSGIEQQRALGIINGTIKVTSDGFGRPVIVDTATNQQSDIGGTETVDQASTRINTEGLSEEEKQELEDAAKEAEEALKAAGFEGRITELSDVSAAFGPEGFTGKIVNVLGGLVGTTPMEDAAEATTVVNALGKVTKFNIISGFAGLRDSVALKAEIEELLPQTGKLRIGKPEALRRFKGIKALLDQAVMLQENTANATNVNTAAVSKANVALNSLRPLAQLYGTIVENIEGEQNAPAGVTDSVFKTPDGASSNVNTSNQLPVITGSNDPKYNDLQVGDKYIYNGNTYIKGN